MLVIRPAFPSESDAIWSILGSFAPAKPTLCLATSLAAPLSVKSREQWLHASLEITYVKRRLIPSKPSWKSPRQPRINVFPIAVPPLRERPEDIPLLVMSFIREFEKKMGKVVRSVPIRVMDELKLYPWPGNVRELRNVIERAVIVTAGGRLNVELPKAPVGARPRTMKEAEIDHILSTLEKTRWRIKGPIGAAAMLGMKPSTLYTKKHLLQIPTRNEKGVMLS